MIMLSAAVSPVDVAMSFSSVLAARSFETESVIVVAVLTGPIFSKSERVALKNEIAQAVRENTDKEVVVTFDNEVFRGIGEQNSDEETAVLIALAKAR